MAGGYPTGQDCLSERSGLQPCRCRHSKLRLLDAIQELSLPVERQIRVTNLQGADCASGPRVNFGLGTQTNERNRDAARASNSGRPPAYAGVSERTDGPMAPWQNARGHRPCVRAYQHLAMPQTSANFTPAERLAARICRSANAQDATDAGPAIAKSRHRSRATVVEAAIKAGFDRGWLRRDGSAYVVTPAGAALGCLRSGKQTGRVMSF
jgi:hypothetical protein